MEHTPPPYEVDHWIKPDGLVCIRSSKSQLRVASQLKPEDADFIVNVCNSNNENLKALEFCRDIAEEELPYTKVGTGAEVALRHIIRKTNEALSRVSA